MGSAGDLERTQRSGPETTRSGRFFHRATGPVAHMGGDGTAQWGVPGSVVPDTGTALRTKPGTLRVADNAHLRTVAGWSGDAQLAFERQ